MQKILLVNPPIRYRSLPATYPYGLALVAAVMESNGFEVDVLDVNAHRLSGRQVVEALTGRDCDLVAVGGLITTYGWIKQFVDEVRRTLPQARIVLGGGVVTWNPEFILRHLPADVAISGEGEDTFLEVIRNFDFERRNGQPIPGAAFIDREGRYIFEPRPVIKDLDRLPLPAWHLFPMEVYVTNSHLIRPGVDLRRGVNVYSGRGCPMNCSYCYHIFGRGVRVRAIGKVIEEIQILKDRYQPDNLLVTDECFTFSKRRVLDFCLMYREVGLDIPFRVSGRLDTIDEEMALALIDAGCVMYGVGVESGSPKILKNMNKQITVDKMAETIQMLRDVGLDIAPTFIHGMIGEDARTVKESIRFYKKMDFRAVNPFYLQPYPGSPLWTPEVERRVLAKYGSLEGFVEALGDASDFVVNLSEVSDHRLQALRRKIKRETIGMNQFTAGLAWYRRQVQHVRDEGYAWVFKGLLKRLGLGAP